MQLIKIIKLKYYHNCRKCCRKYVILVRELMIKNSIFLLLIFAIWTNGFWKMIYASLHKIGKTLLLIRKLGIPLILMGLLAKDIWRLWKKDSRNLWKVQKIVKLEVWKAIKKYLKSLGYIIIKMLSLWVTIGYSRIFKDI